MEENKQQRVMDLARELSDISKNTGRVSFKVSYTATDGNLKIHEDFQRFAFAKANNEYLAAVGKLLEYQKIFEYLVDLDERLSKLEAQDVVPKEEDKKEVDDEIKTF